MWYVRAGGEEAARRLRWSAPVAVTVEAGSGAGRSGRLCEEEGAGGGHSCALSLFSVLRMLFGRDAVRKRPRPVMAGPVTPPEINYEYSPSRRSTAPLPALSNVSYSAAVSVL